MALKCFLPGSALNLASLRIAYCSSVVVFIRKISIPTTDEYWNPYLVSKDFTSNRSLDLSLMLGTNSLGKGDVYLFWSSVLITSVEKVGRNLEIINAMYLA